MNEENRLDALLQGAFEAHEPSRELKNRVLSGRKAPRRQPVWIAFGMAGLAAIAVATAILLPQTSLADTVKQELNAFQGHVAIYRVLPNGKWRRIGDEWLDGTRYRSEDRSEDGEYLIQDRSKGYDIRWDPRNGMVNFMDVKSGGNPLPDVVTTQTLQKLFSNRREKADVSVERVQFAGRAADCATFKWGGKWSNKFYAEPKTHRLLGWSSTRGRRRPGQALEQYETLFVVDGAPMSPHIFDPVVEIAGKPVNLVEDRDLWEKRLSKPLLAKAVDLEPRPGVNSSHLKQSIEVRDVSVNPAGDVFVLFTGVNGAYGTNVVPATVQDSTGGEYRRAGGLRATDERTGLHFDGKALEAAWFVRVRGGALKGPISVGFKQEFEAPNHQAFTYTGEPERLSTDIPTYMPFMTLPIGTSEVWREEHTSECAEERKDAGDYRGEERFLRKLVELRDHATGTRMGGSWLDLQLATCLEKQGRKADAYRQYVKADRIEKAWQGEFGGSGDAMANMISAGLQRLKPGR